MRKFCAAFILIAFLFIGFASHAAEQEGISPSDVAGEPSVFCKVLKAPDPALLGGWQGVHNRFISKKSEFEPDPVQFWLKKVDDKYAIYFYRSKAAGGGKVYRGWREWTINGDEITSDTGVKLFTKNGDVFFSWEAGAKEEPTKLAPIQGSK